MNKHLINYILKKQVFNFLNKNKNILIAKKEDDIEKLQKEVK